MLIDELSDHFFDFFSDLIVEQRLKFFDFLLIRGHLIRNIFLELIVHCYHFLDFVVLIFLVRIVILVLVLVTR